MHRISPDLAAALDFVNTETEFHLGDLITEQSHPKTQHLSEVTSQSTAKGVRQLLSVDDDIIPVVKSAIASDEVNQLTAAIKQTVQQGGRVVFSSCGASGRLAIILESMWRRFWQGTALENQVLSMMTGGERALIRSVESFEDYQTFGEQQVKESKISEKDLLIALTEGGEISSVIGTMKEAAKRGAKVFMLFNNPTDLLISKFARSRDVLSDDRIVKMELVTGPMGLTGSTRMQATTIALLIVGMAMDVAYSRLMGLTEHKMDWYATQFEELLIRISGEKAVSGIAGMVDLETALYKKGGRMTYLADAYLLDIFSDTTERTPTFMIPPFRTSDDLDAPPPWMMAKNPMLSSNETWKSMLRRPPRGLNWDADLYKKMGAADSIITNPPRLSVADILAYHIGHEADESMRRPKDVHLMVYVGKEDSDEFVKAAEELKGSSQLHVACIGNFEHPAKGAIVIPVDFPETRVNLFEHLTVKLVFNTVSTVTMAKLGRIRGNWMIQVDATNKKLIDRATRIVQHFSGLDYKQACIELHKTMYSPDTDRSNFETSYVLQTLNRIS